MSVRCLLLLLLLTPVVGAKPIELAEKVAPDDCFHLKLNMELKGNITFLKDGEKQSMPLEANAQHTLAERVLLVGKGGSIEKTVRLYDTAKATIKAGKNVSPRTLREQRKLMVAQWQKDQLVVYSPNGPLLRDELDLCNEHFDTLHLVDLLPGGERSVGDTWKLGNGVVQALCHFDGLTEQKLVGKLEEIKDNRAVFSITGSATGIDVGSLVKTTIEARCVFDLTSKRLVKVKWKQKDERDQGPTSPASSLEVTTIIERAAVERPEGLKVADGETAPEMLLMEYEHPRQVFGLMVPREWHMVAQTDEHLVLRLMERGDFVAQVTVAVWEKLAAGKHLSPNQFAEAVGRQEGWAADKTLNATELPTDKGRWVYRLAQSGKLNGVEVVQHFYLIAAEDGRQVVLTFCMTPKQVDRLGPRDAGIAANLTFPKSK